MEHSGYHFGQENKWAELFLYHPSPCHTSRGPLSERDHKAILVKIVCLKKPALGERPGFACGTGETLLRGC